MTEQQVVAHFVRGFLAPTETFIGNQISALKAYRPIVACHHQVNGNGYQFDNICSVQGSLAPISSLLDSGMYRFFRRLPWFSTNTIKEWLKTNSVALLHFHFLVDARFFLNVKREMGLPAIVSAYGYDVSSFPKKYRGYGLRYLRSLFDVIELFVAMSKDMRNDLISLGCPEEKIAVHYYGSDTQRFRYPERAYFEKDEITILACGTLHPKKAQHLILQALRIAEKRGMLRRSFRVILVGDGPMRARLSQQVEEYGWQDRVVFTGHIPYHTQRLVDIYRQADVFSLPSITANGEKEGIPGTIVEAMSSGLPVVSTFHAGIPEVIESGKEGILVDEGDVEAMAQAFAALIEDFELRECLGRAAALRAVQKLDVQQRSINLEHLYRGLLLRSR